MKSSDFLSQGRIKIELIKIKTARILVVTARYLYRRYIIWHDFIIAYSSPRFFLGLYDRIMDYTKVCNHPQPSTTTHNHPRPSATIHNHPQRSTTTGNHPQPPTTTYNHPQPPTKPPRTTHNYPQPPATTQNHLQLPTTTPKTTLNHPQPSRSYPKKLKTCHKQLCYCT